MIRALYIEGLSLQEYARTIGKTPQAVSSMIQAVASRAKEFYIWWRREHAGRNRKSGTDAERHLAPRVTSSPSVRVEIPDGLPLLLGVNEASRLLGVSVRTIELHALHGSLRHHVRDGGLVFMPADLRTFADQWVKRGGVFRLVLPRICSDPWCMRSKQNHPVAGFDPVLVPSGELPNRARVRAKKLAQYRNSGLFSPDELSLVELQLHDGSLERWADRHGGSFGDALGRLWDIEQRARRVGLAGIGVAPRNRGQK